jgi:hypothetical protein
MLAGRAPAVIARAGSLSDTPSGRRAAWYKNYTDRFEKKGPEMSIPQRSVAPHFAGLAVTRLAFATWATQVETARRLGEASWQPFLRRPPLGDTTDAR